MDRIEITYTAIDNIIRNHGKVRPKEFGGGKWDAIEEFEIYRNQVGNRYTTLQWKIISQYFRTKYRKLQKENKTLK